MECDRERSVSPPRYGMTGNFNDDIFVPSTPLQKIDTEIKHAVLTYVNNSSTTKSDDKENYQTEHEVKDEKGEKVIDHKVKSEKIKDSVVENKKTNDKQKNRSEKKLFENIKKFIMKNGDSEKFLNSMVVKYGLPEPLSRSTLGSEGKLRFEVSISHFKLLRFKGSKISGTGEHQSAKEAMKRAFR